MTGKLLLGAILVEILLEGLHRQFWTARIKERLLERWPKHSARREFVKCKFCQSWWLGWLVACGMEVAICNQLHWSWHWLWMGPVLAWGAGMLHAVRHALGGMRFIGLGGQHGQW